jgi:hypothetical protein
MAALMFLADLEFAFVELLAIMELGTFVLFGTSGRTSFSQETLFDFGFSLGLEEEEELSFLEEEEEEREELSLETEDEEDLWIESSLEEEEKVLVVVVVVVDVVSFGFSLFLEEVAKLGVDTASKEDVEVVGLVVVKGVETSHAAGVGNNKTEELCSFGWSSGGIMSYFFIVCSISWRKLLSVQIRSS